jgi:tRNA(fMet)-specific endonuclease VapC
MLVLDTDHMSILEWGGDGSATLRERLANVDSDSVATTIISFEEQMRGWMAYIARANSMDQIVKAYGRLRRHLDNYQQIRVLDLDVRSAAAFQGVRRARVRIGTMDLKIAATVKSLAVTLLSRKSNDFGQVPGLKVEDWSM